MSVFSTSPARRFAAGLFLALLLGDGGSLTAAPANPTTGGTFEASFEWSTLENGAIQLKDKGAPVLCYQPLPLQGTAGSEASWRGGYLHPLWSSDGKRILTDDGPQDHPHHRGLFWAWPRITLQGVTHDNWQTKTPPLQRVQESACQTTFDENGATLQVRNLWLDQGKGVVHEEVRLFVRQGTTEGRGLLLELRLTATDTPVTLQGAEGKGYGGLSLRLKVEKDSKVRLETQDGVQEKDFTESPMHWVAMALGEAGAPRSDLVLLSNGPLHSFPRPGWMARHYGCLMACWPGVNSRTLQPGETVILQYQVLIRPDWQ